MDHLSPKTLRMKFPSHEQGLPSHALMFVKLQAEAPKEKDATGDTSTETHHHDPVQYVRLGTQDLLRNTGWLQVLHCTCCMVPLSTAPQCQLNR